MISRIRFYMTFDEDWLEVLEGSLQSVLEEGFEEYDEVFNSFEQYDNTVVLNMMSERNSGELVEIISEIFDQSFQNFGEADFDIEIDLDSPIDDFDKF